MPTHVALLRAVNVGGLTVSMPDLREAAQDIGATDVATHLRSGNLLLTPGDHEAPEATAASLRTSLARRGGADVDVVVLTAAQWREIVTGNPFEEPDHTRLHAMVHPAPLTPAQREASELLAGQVAAAGSRDRLALADRVGYLHLPEGMAASALAARLGRSAATGGRAATTRNWRTVLAVADMLD